MFTRNDVGATGTPHARAIEAAPQESAPKGNTVDPRSHLPLPPPPPRINPRGVHANLHASYQQESSGSRPSPRFFELMNLLDKTDERSPEEKFRDLINSDSSMGIFDLSRTVRYLAEMVDNLSIKFKPLRSPGSKLPANGFGPLAQQVKSLTRKDPKYPDTTMEVSAVSMTVRYLAEMVDDWSSLLGNFEHFALHTTYQKESPGSLAEQVNILTNNKESPMADLSTTIRFLTKMVDDLSDDLSMVQDLSRRLQGLK